MALLLIGASHRTATVDLRSRLAAACVDAGGWLADGSDVAASVSELFVLSTCHRVEFYAVTPKRAAAERAVRRLVLARTGLDLSAPGGAVQVLVGEPAVLHLCRVACGLESMVVGEAEIAGQIRRTAIAARQAGTVGMLLDRVLAGAQRAGGRARSETRIGAGALSVATAAVSVVAESLGSLADRAALVIGAGQAGRQALARLAKRRTGVLHVASRSVRHAREAAEKFGALPVALDRLGPTLASVDAVIAATRADGYLLDAADGRAAFADRRDRPLLAIDLSVPRVLDPALGGEAGITLRTVDDLGDVVRRSVTRRLGEIPRVESIARDEARRAYALFQARLRRAG